MSAYLSSVDYGLKDVGVTLTMSMVGKNHTFHFIYPRASVNSEAHAVQLAVADLKATLTAAANAL